MWSHRSKREQNRNATQLFNIWREMKRLWNLRRNSWYVCEFSVQVSSVTMLCVYFFLFLVLQFVSVVIIYTFFLFILSAIFQKILVLQFFLLYIGVLTCEKISKIFKRSVRWKFWFVDHKYKLYYCHFFKKLFHTFFLHVFLRNDLFIFLIWIPLCFC